MKKILVVMVVMGLMVFAAGSAFAKIVNSKHDLTSQTTNSAHVVGGSLSSCQYCHTPHLKAAMGTTAAPLWNRSMSASGSFANAGATGNYTVYGASSSGVTGTTLSGSSVGAPGPNSKTCLSCHDGTLSIATVLVGNQTAPTFGGADVTNGGVNSGKLISNSTIVDTVIGPDLRSDHPVGVVYNSAASAAGLSGVINASGQVNGKKWKIYGGGDNVGKVECGSCHDPHGDDSSVAGSTIAPFLKDTKSTMCYDCHSGK
jgi:predicted CXXCH cytochrome family protein